MRVGFSSAVAGKSRLDAAEGHAAAAAHADHGWSRRFHAACRRALEPAKSYFKKRQELRKAHAQEVASALEAVRTIPDDSQDWASIAKTRHTVVDALRSLDRIDPHERKALAKNLKAALTSLDARLDSRYADIEKRKAALIAEAEALAGGEPPRGAAAAARELQQRWRDAGNGRRDRDQAQWKAFRAALDAMFGKLDAERSQRTARDAESRSRATALCAELELPDRGLRHLEVGRPLALEGAGQEDAGAEVAPAGGEVGGGRRPRAGAGDRRSGQGGQSD